MATKPKPYYKLSPVTKITYNLFDCVIIINPSQVAFYMDHGLTLLDIEVSEDRKTGEPILIFLFNKEETKECYDLWCSRRRIKKPDEGGESTE